MIKDCDPDTHEPDDEGYDDEYAVRARFSDRAVLLDDRR